MTPSATPASDEETFDAGKPYIIQPGDTALTIALMHEVDEQEIIKHPKNSPIFEEKQRDPHMLAPGEMLFVPPPQAPAPTVAAKSQNQFVARTAKVHVHLAFASEKGVLKNEPFVVSAPVSVVGKKRSRKEKKEPLRDQLDKDGKLSLVVPALIGSFTICFPERDMTHEIMVGGLDPADVQSGINARLLHRGYLPLDQEIDNPYFFETETAEKATLKSFQEAFMLEPSGHVDSPTKEALVKENGC
jgi:hypothetical protein